MTDSIYAWSQTAASNSNADASINWAEFQDPDTVNDSARQMMARVAAYISDTAPKRTSTGTGNAYAVTSDAAGASLVNGMTICFIADRANTAAATLNVDGLGAKPFRPKVGTEFNANDILANQPVIAFYVSATQEWVALNTGYHVSSTAAGIGLQAIIASLPKLGDIVISADATPAAGRIRLTETTQAILKSSYPELNTWLSARSYPWGSTATHFNLPPAAGYFLRFAANNDTVDTTGSRAAGSTQADANKTATVPAAGLTAATVNSATTATVPFAQGGTNFQNGAFPAPAVAGTTVISIPAQAAATTVGGFATLPGEDEVRTKNVAFHADIIASTADSAAQIAIFGFPFQWDTGTAAGDPGAGRVRGNNATLASITALYFSFTDRWSQNITGLLSQLISGNPVHLSRVGAGGNRVIFRLSANASNAGTYYVVPVTVMVSAGATFANNDNLVMEYGLGSSAAGDVTAAAAFGTTERIIVSDGTGKGVKASGVTIDSLNNCTGFNSLDMTSDTQVVFTGTTYGGSATFLGGRRGRGAAAAPTAILANDAMFNVGGRGYDGSAMSGTQALFSCRAAENWTTTARGTYWSVFTQPNGTIAGQIERVRWDHDGTMRPVTDNALSLGASGSRWSAVYAATGTINTSDEREKDVTGDLSFAGRMVDLVSPILYKWKVGGKEVIPDPSGEMVPCPSGDTMDDPSGATEIVEITVLQQIGESTELHPVTRHVTRPKQVPVMVRKMIEVNIAGNRQHAGFRAQDLKAAMDTIAVDFGAWGREIKDDANSRQWVRPDQLVPVLWQSERDTRAELKALRAEFDALKASLAA